jgi:hypothetical protein
VDSLLEPATEYEPPALVRLGTVHDLTLTFSGRKCWWGKEFGGHDGYYFLGIPVPISNCSP